jgi:hypothetical protein
MICPGCNSDITCSTIEQIAERYQCDTCGYIGTPDEKKENIKYPNTFLGFILFAIYVVIIIFLITFPGANPEFSLTIFYLLTIALFVVYLYFVFSFHSILNDLTDNRYPVSASRSVWGHFIPIYNFIFIFVWPNAFVDYYNENHRRKRLLKFVGGITILLAIIINYIIGFGVLLLYGVITYYNLKLKELVVSEIERLKSLIPTEQTASQKNELAE